MSTIRALLDELRRLQMRGIEPESFDLGAAAYCEILNEFEVKPEHVGLYAQFLIAGIPVRLKDGVA